MVKPPNQAEPNLQQLQRNSKQRNSFIKTAILQEKSQPQLFWSLWKMFIFAFMELQLGEFGLKFREWSDIVN